MRDIEAIIDKARAVVVLWSELSLQSDFVMGEALKAASLGSYIGVTIEPDVKAPVAFLAKHNLALDLASSPEARIALAAQLERRLGAPRAPAPPEETVAERLAEPAPEAEFWRGIHDGARAKDFEAYLAKYGQDGLFAELARGRIAALRKPAAPATSQGPSRDAALIASPAGTVFRDSFLAPIKMRHDEEISEGPELCVIPAGRFLMGSPAEEPERFDGEGPQHEVRIARPFALGRYAVTFDEYDAFCAATRARRPGDAGWGRGRRPAIKVSWKDADAYCGWLSEQTGATYRLPSEAEWEYACWAGTTTPFWWGREITPEQANYNGDYAYAGGGAKGVYRKKTEP
ncbi:MAG: formylglycine-generating enzyme family protein, partial [Pseudomonadota bacterium]